MRFNDGIPEITPDEYQVRRSERIARERACCGVYFIGNRQVSEPLYDIIHEAIDTHQDINAAVNFVVRRLKQNQSLLAELVEPLVEAAIRAKIHGTRAIVRREIKGLPVDATQFAKISGEHGVRRRWGWLRKGRLRAGTR